MKIDTTLAKDIDDVHRNAREAEAAGYDGLWVGETRHDPFLLSLRAGDATADLTVGTSIAIAFARTPMTLANVGFDLARYSRGRFVLGLGSQVKPHIERRFSMPWSRPAARMREFVLAMRAIWDTWQNGTPLSFEGEFYTHTLMTPFFSPEAHEWGPPPVYLAAVGELMTEAAAEVADGMFFHAFSTPRYLREVTLPALERGRAKIGRTLSDFVLAGPAFATVGRNEAELATAIAGTKKQIAFYASTPAYRGVLELHGWGDLQTELTRMSKQNRWSEMGDLIDDEILRTFSVVGSPAEVGKGLRERYGDVATRITFYATYESDPAIWPEVLDAVRS
ncbi:LLM class F420-dependent oxidoreductase [Frankia sp. Cr2]|uniref:LLM class F420-dependent oxidoreductase n=1 Tax=Frankia sp. Cr2 TaxID=3073932 RepID=UPI002AD28FCE|nr:LLM class F420-dependent oxidoreductase [Frankia sp. Cr2]